MISKRLSVIPMILSLALISVSPAFALETTVTTGSTLNVLGACGVSVFAVTDMDYGPLGVGDTSGRQELQITGTGSAPSLVEVAGTHWLTDDGRDPATTVILGENTRFTFTDQTWTQMTGIDTTAQIIIDGKIDNGSTNSTFWQVEVIMDDPTYQGAVAQDITIEVVGCV